MAMKLPNAAHAFIDYDKLLLYCLSESHPSGRHKAHVFREALGVTAENALLLRDALLEAALTNEAEAGVTDQFGSRFRVQFVMETTAGRATIVSAWIIRTGEDFPRLVTCFVS